MHIRDLAGKHICILGFGREGQAMLTALEEYAPGCDITIADQNEKLERKTKNYKRKTGQDYLSGLDSFDVIIKSPGIPPNSKLTAQSSKLTSATQIFLDSIADTGATVIGVTGSKGKSTTASLIHTILSAQGSRLKAQSFLVGNIGDPAIAHLRDAKPNTFFVQEMSSYQLADLTTSPHIAVVTAFFPEHLDYHGSLEAYREAKGHITRFQTKDDIVFFAADSAGAHAIAEASPGKHIPFSAKDAPIPIEETKLIGKHNASAVAAAFLVSHELGVPRDAAIQAIKEFQRLPHRLQALGTHHGIEWVDDSISTTPESAIAALDALDNRVATVILGGQDRGYDFRSLGKRIARSSVSTVILLGESSPRIREAIEKAHASVQFFHAKNMEEAVKIARNAPTPHAPRPTPPIVLLSPASPSYDMFKNFEERGNIFLKEIVRHNEEPRRHGVTRE